MINSTAISQGQMATDSYTDLSSVQAIRNLENKDEALEKIAQQFESMMTRMMMKSMRSANKVFAEGNFLSSQEGDMYQEMLDDQLSLTLSKGSGLGIADVMVRQLKGRFGNSSEEKNSVVSNITDYMDRRNSFQGPTPAVNLNAVKNEKVNSKEVADTIEFDGSVQHFVDKLYPMAEKAAKVLGVNPEVLLAQSALETGWGRKVTGKQNGESSFNLFNIKADKRWHGESVSVPTLEFQNGMPVRERADFRAYSSMQHSFDDYVDFVSNSGRYDKALQGSDTESYIRDLAEAGYATDGKYAEKVIRIMNSSSLKEAVEQAATHIAGEG